MSQPLPRGGARPVFFDDGMARAVPAKSNKKWTPEEDKRLLELEAAGKPAFSIAAELRRTGGAIHSRLSILRARERLAAAISDPPQSTASRPNRWTLDDDKRLLELRARGVSFVEIAKSLGRTRSAIIQRARVLQNSAATQNLSTAD